MDESRSATNKEYAVTEMLSARELMEYAEEHKELWKEQIEDAGNTTNFVKISGEIIAGPEFDHHSFDIDFYQITIRATRSSGNKDDLIVILPDNLMDEQTIFPGNHVTVTGDIRILKILNPEAKNTSILYVYALAVESGDEEEDKNSVVLTGNISRKIKLRKTPFGRIIAEFFLTVTRKNGAKIFVPCIAWGKMGFAIANMEPESAITVSGRLQSRDYVKQLENGEQVTRTTHELSLNGFVVKSARKTGDDSK